MLLAVSIFIANYINLSAAQVACCCCYDTKRLLDSNYSYSYLHCEIWYREKFLTTMFHIHLCNNINCIKAVDMITYFMSEFVSEATKLFEPLVHIFGVNSEQINELFSGLVIEKNI